MYKEIKISKYRADASNPGITGTKKKQFLCFPTQSLYDLIEAPCEI